MIGRGLKTNHYNLLLLIVIICMGIGLRLFRIGEWSFSIDELFTLNNAQKLLASPLTLHKITEHPSTSLLVYLSTQIFGVSEWGARFLPTIISIITMPILYLSVRKLLDNVTALILTFITAIAPWHIFWAQSVRFYTLLSLLYICALLFFYWGLEKNKPRYIYLSLLILGIAVSERLLALFFVPVVIVYLLLLIILPFESPPRLKLNVFYGVIGLGFLFTVFFAWEFIQDITLWQQIYMTWIGRGPIDVFVEYIKGIDAPIALFSFLGAILGIYKKNRFILLLTINIAIPLLLLMGISTFQFTHNRYMFISSISSFIIAAWALQQLIFHQNGKARWITISFVIMMLSIPINDLLPYYSNLSGWRIDWKSANSYVESQFDPDDMLMSNNVEVSHFYSGLKVYGMDSKPDALEQVNGRYQRVWFIIGGTIRLDHDLHNWVRQHATIMYSIEPKLHVYVYDPIQNDT